MTGLFNLLTGLQFDIPMVVQPMKTVASVAISNKLPPNQILAAGILVGGAVFALGITRSIALVNRLVPLSLVRGIQLGMGFTLMESAIKLVQASGVWSSANFWIFAEGYVMSGLVMLLVAWHWHNHRFPIALVLFLLGLIIAIIHAIRDPLHPAPQFGVSGFGVHHPSAHDFEQALMLAALPQLPLTCLNSVVAVHKLAVDTFVPLTATSDGHPALEDTGDAPDDATPRPVQDDTSRAAEEPTRRLLNNHVHYVESSPPSSRGRRSSGVNDGTAHITVVDVVPLASSESSEFDGLPRSNGDTSFASDVPQDDHEEHLKLARALHSTATPDTYSVTRIAVAVGAMNLIGCWFGAHPSCHGMCQSFNLLLRTRWYAI